MGKRQGRRRKKAAQSSDRIRTTVNDNGHDVLVGQKLNEITHSMLICRARDDIQEYHKYKYQALDIIRDIPTNQLFSASEVPGCDGLNVVPILRIYDVDLLSDIFIKEENRSGLATMSNGFGVANFITELFLYKNYFLHRYNEESDPAFKAAILNIYEYLDGNAKEIIYLIYERGMTPFQDEIGEEVQGEYMQVMLHANSRYKTENQVSAIGLGCKVPYKPNAMVLLYKCMERLHASNGNEEESSKYRKLILAKIEELPVEWIIQELEIPGIKVLPLIFGALDDEVFKTIISKERFYHKYYMINDVDNMLSHRRSLKEISANSEIAKEVINSGKEISEEVFTSFEAKVEKIIGLIDQHFLDVKEDLVHAKENQDLLRTLGRKPSLKQETLEAKSASIITSSIRGFARENKQSKQDVLEAKSADIIRQSIKKVADFNKIEKLRQRTAEIEKKFLEEKSIRKDLIVSQLGRDDFANLLLFHMDVFEANLSSLLIENMISEILTTFGIDSIVLKGSYLYSAFVKRVDGVVKHGGYNDVDFHVAFDPSNLPKFQSGENTEERLLDWYKKKLQLVLPIDACIESKPIYFDSKYRNDVLLPRRRYLSKSVDIDYSKIQAVQFDIQIAGNPKIEFTFANSNYHNESYVFAVDALRYNITKGLGNKFSYRPSVSSAYCSSESSWPVCYYKMLSGEQLLPYYINDKLFLGDNAGLTNKKIVEKFLKYTASKYFDPVILRQNWAFASCMNMIEADMNNFFTNPGRYSSLSPNEIVSLALLCGDDFLSQIDMYHNSMGAICVPLRNYINSQNNISKSNSYELDGGDFLIEDNPAHGSVRENQATPTTITARKSPESKEQVLSRQNYARCTPEVNSEQGFVRVVVNNVHTSQGEVQLGLLQL